MPIYLPQQIDISAVQRNIFSGAHDAIWQGFPWHTGAASYHSSQALAVSVFGAIAVHPERQSLVDETLHLMFGWDPQGDDGWRVELERNLPRSLLGERRPTQADVLLLNKTSAVLLECKFTESGGGPCSQAKPLSSGEHKGTIQCDGNYREQTNPVNGKTARCALSAKGIRYWTYIPKYFDLDGHKDHEPCPFAGPAYQYMRNALAAARWAKRYDKARAAFGLVYVAGEPFPISNEVTDPQSEWGQFVARLRPDSLLVAQAISYQRLLETWCRRLPEDQVLARLADWVTERVRDVGQTIPPGDPPIQLLR